MAKGRSASAAALESNDVGLKPTSVDAQMTVPEAEENLRP
jgi:hypothetical protein